jgi:acetolactate synthase I/II/III large subunit
VTHGLVGDAKQVLQGIINQISNETISPNSEYGDEIQFVAKKVRESLLDTLGPYKQFAHGIRELAPENAIFVRDVTVPANLWGSRVIDIYQPRTSIYVAGGGIGQGLPLAIGAQAGCKDRVVILMAGDGGYMLNVGEMATAAHENLPLVVLLFDDSGYGVLRNIQDATYGNQVAVDLYTPDFVQLGESMGFTSNRVGSTDEFLTELKAAIARRKPSLIVIDMKSIGQIARKYAATPGAVPDYTPKKIN